MVRTQIYLTETEKSHLSRLSKQTGRSQSDIIRQAIDLFAKRYAPQDRRERLRKARGMWRDRSDLPDLRTLREEFDRSFETGED
jgi:Arc/MetJ-type ribon-helix-helix transcriptional regulator